MWGALLDLPLLRSPLLCSALPCSALCLEPLLLSALLLPTVPALNPLLLPCLLRCEPITHNVSITPQSLGRPPPRQGVRLQIIHPHLDHTSHTWVKRRKARNLEIDLAQPSSRMFLEEKLRKCEFSEYLYEFIWWNLSSQLLGSFHNCACSPSTDSKVSILKQELKVAASDGSRLRAAVVICPPPKYSPVPTLSSPIYNVQQAAECGRH